MKIVLSEEPAIELLGIYPKDIPPNHKDTCSTMFIVPGSVIAKRMKELRCPSTKEWMQKMWLIYIRKYYSAITKEDIRNFAGKWMELENVLNEVTQT